MLGLTPLLAWSEASPSQAGAPQTTFAYERQVAKAARILGIEPLEFRRRNALRLGDTTSTGQRLERSVGSMTVLDRVEEQVAEPAPRAPAVTNDDLQRGRGLAFYFHGAGFTGSGEAYLQSEATVNITADGLFEVRTSSTGGDLYQALVTEAGVEVLMATEEDINLVFKKQLR